MTRTALLQFPRTLRKQQLYRFCVASLGAASLISLTHYLIATKPLTEAALTRQRQTLNRNQANITQWWTGEVTRIRKNLNNPSIIDKSLRILQSKKPLRTDRNTALSQSLENLIANDNRNRNSVSLLTKGGIVVFSTKKEKLHMYQPLKNTTTSLELEELPTTPLNFFTDPATDLPCISVALPVMTPQGKRAGFLAIDLNLRRLNGVLDTSAGGADPSLHQAVPMNVYLAARTSLDRVTAIAPPADLSTSEAAAFRFQPLNSAGIHKALDGESGEGLYLNSNSEPVIGVYQYLPNFRTALLVESLQHDVYAPARHQALWIFVVGLLISLTPCLAALLINRQPKA